MTPEPTPEVPFAVSGPVSGPGSTALEPGTYRMRGPGQSPAGWPGYVTVTVPDGWYARSALRGAGLVRTEGGGVAELSFNSVGNLVADPCATAPPARGPMLDPPLGPSVDELVAGLRSLSGFQVTEPVDITLDGWDGKQLELTHPAGCADALLGLTPPDDGESWEIMSREGWHSTFWILDVEGLRFVVIAAYEENPRGNTLRDLSRMVGSIDIEP